MDKSDFSDTARIAMLESRVEELEKRWDLYTRIGIFTAIAFIAWWGFVIVSRVT